MIKFKPSLLYKKIRNYFVRYTEAGDLFELFLISAVVSLILIRVFLNITGYPLVGGGNFHIAHMLWGGFGMMVALLIWFFLLNKEVRYFATILGGVGFGTFIDELGKFITTDNNYFFQPTIALIYVIFILLFLASRYLERNQKFTDKEYIINALEIIKDIYSQDLDEDEKDRALKYLNKIDSEDSFITDLKQLLRRSRAEPTEENVEIKKARKLFRKFYFGLVKKTWFKLTFVAYFVGGGFVSLYKGVYFFRYSQDLSFWSVGYVLSALLAGTLTLIGLAVFARSRLDAYHWFRRGVLVSIFLTQFFLFYKDQLSAISGLLVSVFFLITFQYFIDQENKSQD